MPKLGFSDSLNSFHVIRERPLECQFGNVTIERCLKNYAQSVVGNHTYFEAFSEASIFFFWIYEESDGRDY